MAGKVYLVRKSRRGCLPSTAKDKNINISGVEKMDSNIHAGTKYPRFMAHLGD